MNPSRTSPSPAVPPRPQRSGPPNRAAFTLVELLAVIGIMVLLLAFTLPVLRGGNYMNKTVWDIAGVVEKARAYAQSQNTYVWIGLNAEDVSTSTDKRVAIFLVASSDGTQSTAGANLVQLDRLHVFENVGILDSEDFEYVNRPSDDIHFMDTPSSSITFPNTVKYFKRTSSSARVPVDLYSSGNNYILRVDPSGSISPVGTTTEWVELGLASVRGGKPLEDDTAVIQIASLIGRVHVHRPGSVISQTSSED